MAEELPWLKLRMKILQRFLVLELKVAVSGTVTEIERLGDTKKKNFWVMTLRINRRTKGCYCKSIYKVARVMQLIIRY